MASLDQSQKFKRDEDLSTSATPSSYSTRITAAASCNTSPSLKVDSLLTSDQGLLSQFKRLIKAQVLLKWNTSRVGTILWGTGLALFNGTAAINYYQSFTYAREAYLHALPGRLVAATCGLGLFIIGRCFLRYHKNKRKDPSVRVVSKQSHEPVRQALNNAIYNILKGNYRLSSEALGKLINELRCSEKVSKETITSLTNSSKEFTRHLKRIKAIEDCERKSSTRSRMSKGLLAAKINVVLRDLIDVGKQIAPDIESSSIQYDRDKILERAGLFARYIYRSSREEGHGESRKPMMVFEGMAHEEIVETYIRKIINTFHRISTYTLRKEAALYLDSESNQSVISVLSRRIKAAVVDAMSASPAYVPYLYGFSRTVIVGNANIGAYEKGLNDGLRIHFIDDISADKNASLLKGVVNLAQRLYVEPNSVEMQKKGGMTVLADEKLLSSWMAHKDTTLIAITGPNSIGYNEVVAFSVVHLNDKHVPDFAKDVVNSVPLIGQKGFLTFIGVEPEFEDVQRRRLSYLTYMMTELLFATRVDIVCSQIAESNHRSQGANFNSRHAAIGRTGRKSLNFKIKDDGDVVPNRFDYAFRGLTEVIRSRLLNQHHLISRNLKCKDIKDEDDKLFNCFKQQVRDATIQLEQALSTTDEKKQEHAYKNLVEVLEDGFYFLPDELFGKPYIPIRTSARIERIISKIELAQKVGFALSDALPELLAEIREEFGFLEVR